MFLKLDGYFLDPNGRATVLLYNGTFEASENTIDRDRMTDVSLVAAGQRRRVDTSQWHEEGFNTVLDLTTGAAGTYLVGVSTRARTIELDAEAFNGYLEHDGVVDMLEKRKADGTLGQDANELYSKHVKTVFQVGDARTDDWSTVLGYPIEFVPRANPYALTVGDRLSVQLLRDGAPLADQLVYAGSSATHSHSHDGGEEHTHTAATTLRTDAEGMLDLPITEAGVQYLRTIHMAERNDDGLTHESNWATLTFGVAEAEHDHGHDHNHAHADEGIGSTSILLGVGSLLLIAGLFVFFNRRTA